MTTPARQRGVDIRPPRAHMTRREHYEEAERLVAEFAAAPNPGGGVYTIMPFPLVLAQIHATLATATIFGRQPREQWRGTPVIPPGTPEP